MDEHTKTLANIGADDAGCFSTLEDAQRVVVGATATVDGLAEAFAYACAICQAKPALLAAVMLIKRGDPRMTTCSRELFLEMAALIWDSVHRTNPCPTSSGRPS